MTTEITSYQPWRVAQTFPVWQIPLATDGGQEDLTGVDVAKITLVFRDPSTTPPTDTPGTGTLSIQSVNPGVLFYKPSTTDVDGPFTGQIVIKAQVPPSNGASDQVEYDPITFNISY